MDHVHQYCSLRATDILPTEKLVQFSAPRRIPIHYISSASVGRVVGHQTLADMSIAEYLPSGDDDGYTASKWASEVVLEHAHQTLSIPFMIHRPTTLLWKDIPEISIMANLLHCAQELRAVPELQAMRGFFDLIPLDVTARTIVREALRRVQGINFSNIGGVRRLPVRDLHVLLVMEMNASVRKTSFEEWMDLVRHARMHKERVHIFEEFDKHVKSLVYPEVERSRELA
jgi:thioester reductase-like protein